jgi:hypothetical protein
VHDVSATRVWICPTPSLACPGPLGPQTRRPARKPRRPARLLPSPARSCARSHHPTIIGAATAVTGDAGTRAGPGTLRVVSAAAPWNSMAGTFTPICRARSGGGRRLPATVMSREPRSTKGRGQSHAPLPDQLTKLHVHQNGMRAASTQEEPVMASLTTSHGSVPGTQEHQELDLASCRPPWISSR